VTIPTEVIIQMATLGLSPEQARSVAEMLSAVETATKAEAEVVIEQTKEKGRERWRRWDEKRRSNADKRLQTLDGVSKHSRAGDTRGLDKPLITVIEPQDKKTSHTQSDVAAFQAALAGDVDGETLAEFIKVRRKKRGALTGYSAKLFREDAAACSMTVQQAARECVRSSWITVKPEYFASRRRAGPTPIPKRTVAQAADDLLREMEQADEVSNQKIERHQAPVIAIPFQWFG